MENINQEDHLVLKGAAKVLLQGMSVTWTSPLSENIKKLASLAFNQFTLPVLPWYLMWTQVWPIADLQQLQDREVRKVIVNVQSRGKHHLGSTELMYLPRKLRGRGPVKLYSNSDPVMQVGRRCEENTEENGRRALIKDAKK